MSKGSDKVKRWRKRHPEAAKAMAKNRDMRVVRDAARRKRAQRFHYAPPPLEKDCPPRPLDSRCQGCGRLAKLMMDHDHDTGVFRGWVCQFCNSSRERRSGVGQFAFELAIEARRLQPRKGKTK